MWSLSEVSHSKDINYSAVALALVDQSENEKQKVLDSELSGSQEAAHDGTQHMK